jgi:SAM-dependent MidA family methyltransferase
VNPGVSDLSPSRSLRERIAEEIRRNGPIPFSRYMELCLYEPELGYYSRAREQFGKAGDFYTSSDVHAVFGRLLARQFEEMWRALGSPERIDVVELGPGRGLFARDVLDWSAKHFPDFARTLRYTLIEQSEHLRAKLQERLAEHLDAGRCQITSWEPTASPTLSPKGEQGDVGDDLIVFANEFFDALPVEVIDHRGALRLGFEQGRFTETFVAPPAAELEFIDRYSVHPEAGERVEVCLAALAWMDRIAEVFNGRRGFAVLIDYGYTREEQLAGRHRDTIMTYRQHVARAAPYEAPGEQDITAHVNFTALRARAEERGLKPLALLTQSQFLIGIGEETEFADAFQDCRLPQERAKVALQLKHLISPSGMGETFQVLLLSHDVGEVALDGTKIAR